MIRGTVVELRTLKRRSSQGIKRGSIFFKVVSLSLEIKRITYLQEARERNYM